MNNDGLTIAGIVGGLTITGILDLDSNCNSVQSYTKVSLFTDWIIEVISDATTCPPPP